MELLTRVVDVVRSVRISVEVVKILAKLKKAAKSVFVLSMETVGVETARKRSAQAVGLGYAEARGWASDFAFIRYLTVIHLGNPVGFG